MNKILKKVALLSFVLFSAVAYGQGIKDIRINEIMVNNETSYQTSYGNRDGWVELHNTGYSDVNIAGCHLVVSNGSKEIVYKIPKNDPNTIITPQGYALFFADGMGTRGTFHLNFKLSDGNTISLFDQSNSGEPASTMSYSPSMKADVSQGWMLQEDGELALISELASTTPGATNNTIELASRADTFKEHDPNGFTMAITAMSVVFTALLVLFLVFKSIGKFFTSPAKPSASTTSSAPVVEGDISSEVIAAIAVALKKYDDDMQDAESNILTINRVAKAYSPWSSKIYGIGQLPQKR